MKKWRSLFHGLGFDIKGMLRPVPFLYALFIGFFMVMTNANTFEEGRILKQWLETFGGFEYQEFIDVHAIIRWTLLLLPWFFAVLFSMEGELSGGCQTTLYRFCSYRRWYLSKVVASACACGVIMAAVFFGVLLGSWAFGITRWDIRLTDSSGFSKDALPFCLAASLLLYCHVLMLTQWQMLWQLLTGSSAVAAAAYLLLPIVGVHGASNIEGSLMPLYSPANLGMLIRSDRLAVPGFSFTGAIIAQLVIAAICAAIGLGAVKHCRIASRVTDER